MTQSQESKNLAFWKKMNLTADTKNCDCDNASILGGSGSVATGSGHT